MHLLEQAFKLKSRLFFTVLLQSELLNLKGNMENIFMAQWLKENLHNIIIINNSVWGRGRN